ncbi:MAG: cob(I)yrinic acid a,c-diamide adenosyltransferase [Bdellovibrionota bacterium]
MAIYTRTGDHGETGLFGGGRVSKDSIRIRCFGTFDELNSVIGVVLSENTTTEDLRAKLLRIQHELFQIGAELATKNSKNSGTTLISDERVSNMEREIDDMETKLAHLKTFILPGGSRAGALLHLARTVSRRAERGLVSLSKKEGSIRPALLKYANRLSDYLFVCARYANHEAGISETAWNATLTLDK